MSNPYLKAMFGLVIAFALFVGGVTAAVAHESFRAPTYVVLHGQNK